MNPSKEKIADDLKGAMRQFPSPVAIATAAIGKEKRGITIGSFTSLSLDPPLISFNIDQEAQIHNLIKKATHFAVHIPTPDQVRLCNHFAIPDQSAIEQFSAVNHYRSAYGIPLLKNITTVIQCRSYETFAAGDHTIIVGEAVQINQQNKNPGILYYDQAYRSIGDAVPVLNNIYKSA